MSIHDPHLTKVIDGKWTCLKQGMMVVRVTVSLQHLLYFSYLDNFSITPLYKAILSNGYICQVYVCITANTQSL